MRSELPHLPQLLPASPELHEEGPGLMQLHLSTPQTQQDMEQGIVSVEII